VWDGEPGDGEAAQGEGGSGVSGYYTAERSAEWHEQHPHYVRTMRAARLLGLDFEGLRRLEREGLIRRHIVDGVACFSRADLEALTVRLSRGRAEEGSA
jgi:hypothetical protein